jgi:hypothetical protein
VQAQVIACGHYHTAAINREGKVVCWGNNRYGQCNVPVSLERAIAISCGVAHTAAITHDRRVVCWGRNDNGECSVPDGLENVIAVSCGYWHTAALTQKGKVICWGYNKHKQCSVPTTLENVVAISCGECHTVALTDKGIVVCWGDDDCSQCPPSLDVVYISAGAQHIAALTVTGNVVCWGSNVYGQCAVPADIHTRNVVSIACGWRFTVALTQDCRIIWWGRNADRQPTMPTHVQHAVAISAGVRHVCVVDNGCRLRCWRYDDYVDGDEDNQDNEGADRCAVPEDLQVMIPHVDTAEDEDKIIDINSNTGEDVGGICAVGEDVDVDNASAHEVNYDCGNDSSEFKVPPDAASEGLQVVIPELPTVEGTLQKRFHDLQTLTRVVISKRDQVHEEISELTILLRLQNRPLLTRFVEQLRMFSVCRGCLLFIRCAPDLKWTACGVMSAALSSRIST